MIVGKIIILYLISSIFVCWIGSVYVCHYFERLCYMHTSPNCTLMLWFVLILNRRLNNNSLSGPFPQTLVDIPGLAFLWVLFHCHYFFRTYKTFSFNSRCLAPKEDFVELSHFKINENFSCYVAGTCPSIIWADLSPSHRQELSSTPLIV